MIVKVNSKIKKPKTENNKKWKHDNIPPNNYKEKLRVILPI